MGFDLFPSWLCLTDLPSFGESQHYCVFLFLTFYSQTEKACSQQALLSWRQITKLDAGCVKIYQNINIPIGSLETTQKLLFKYE